MTEAGIDAGFTRDLFIALGEPLDSGAAWSVRIQTKPFIQWIWLGTVFMAVGGLLAACDRRYRRVGVRSKESRRGVPTDTQNATQSQNPAMASLAASSGSGTAQ